MPTRRWPLKGKGGMKNTPVVDEIAAAGLNAGHVRQFEALAFKRKKGSVSILTH